MIVGGAGIGVLGMNEGVGVLVVVVVKVYLVVSVVVKQQTAKIQKSILEMGSVSGVKTTILFKQNAFSSSTHIATVNSG